jgi:hypothetical protein
MADWLMPSFCAIRCVLPWLRLAWIGGQFNDLLNLAVAYLSWRFRTGLIPLGIHPAFAEAAPPKPPAGDLGPPVLFLGCQANSREALSGLCQVIVTHQTGS